jgi:hypothetical protein
MVCIIRNRQQIKGFTVGGDEATILPSGVREYKIEQTPLFSHFLSFVEICSPVSEFEKPDTLIHVCLVRMLMLFHLAQDVGLLRAPFTALLVEELLWALSSCWG